MIKQFGSLVDLMMAFPSEQSAIDRFWAIRWPDGAFCPHCSSEKYTTSQMARATSAEITASVSLSRWDTFLRIAKSHWLSGC